MSSPHALSAGSIAWLLMSQEQRDDIKAWIEEQGLSTSSCMEIEIAADAERIVVRLVMACRDESGRMVWTDGDRLSTYSIDIFRPVRPFPWMPDM